MSRDLNTGLSLVTSLPGLYNKFPSILLKFYKKKTPMDLALKLKLSPEKNLAKEILKTFSRVSLLLNTYTFSGWRLCDGGVQPWSAGHHCEGNDNDNDNDDDDHCEGLECPGEWRQVPCDQVHQGRHQLQPPGGWQQGEKRHHQVFVEYLQQRFFFLLKCL